MENLEHFKELLGKLPNDVLEAERVRVAERIAELSQKYEVIDQILFSRTSAENYGAA